MLVLSFARRRFHVALNLPFFHRTVYVYVFAITVRRFACPEGEKNEVEFEDARHCVGALGDV